MESLLEFLDKKLNGDSETLKEFIRNFNHSDLTVRSYMLLMGWIIRASLPRKSVCPPLLENLAGSLTLWGMCAGLCYAMFDSFEDFQDYIFNYRVTEKKYEDQYKERIGLIRDNGIEFFTNQLYAKENDIRSVAGDYAMGLRCA